MKKAIVAAIVALSFGLPVLVQAQAIWGNATTPCTSWNSELPSAQEVSKL